MTTPKTTNKTPLLKLTGLWRHRKADGTEYYSGSLGALRVLIFPNSFAGEGDPEFVLYLTANAGGRERVGDGGRGGKEQSREPGEEEPQPVAPTPNAQGEEENGARPSRLLRNPRGNS